MSAARRPLADFAASLDFAFADPSLLQRAFVHRSYLNEAGEDFQIPDNERLEFLGDAVLGFVASELLFRRYPQRLEGELTNLRAALVRRETLARFAEELALGEFLLLGHGEEESGGRTRPATLCATFEAVVGAIYLDSGLERVREFLEDRLTAEVERVAPSALAKDPKSRLQEWIQNELGVTPRYKTVLTEGPDHARFFTVQVTADKIPYGVGRGRSKQEAAQSAAAMTLHRFGQPAPEYVPNPELEAEFAPIAPAQNSAIVAEG
ncbi:MAG: ribonuclease III [Chloroflexi bacterium]|nr:MAG: ribonuclease III [Chloroflexota bacterium]